ncbi:MAG: hypothetical protein KDD67_01975 [Ignavibacteriae bacterium]|nr:hypothetical protein [Ignavibacteriota bacterium]MCB9215413.1 hypothetical protein [Ignavibacteria bacterium]
MRTLHNLLTLVHVVAGSTALVTALAATLAKTVNLKHRWHLISGRIFFWSMLTIALTAFPMAIIHPNTFLFLIGIFSLYLTLAGWRFATNRRGVPRWFDWTTAGLMLLTSLIMVSLALYKMIVGTGGGVILLSFGVIGGLLSSFDLKQLKGGGVKGRERIARHLIMMLSATIAALTAFTVNNITMQPALIPWLGPTVLIVPVIVIWSGRVQKGR